VKKISIHLVSLTSLILLLSSSLVPAQVLISGSTILTGAGGGGGGTPGGSSGSVQYNSSGAFAGLSGSGLLKLNGSAAPTIATPNVDYLLPSGQTFRSLTTTGTSGAATLNSITGVLNIPQYSGGGGGIGYPPAGVGNSTGTAWGTSYQVGVGAGNLVQLNGSAQLPAVSAINLTNFPATLAIYPPAGVPNSTGTAWGTSYGVGVSANNLVQLNGSSQLPAVSAANLTNFPTLNQNTTGTAANLSGTPTLPNGASATTQTLGDNTTKLATDAFVIANSSSSSVITTLGDTIAGNLSGVASRVAGNTTAIAGFYSETGNGTVSALPIWVPGNGTGNVCLTVSCIMTTPDIGNAMASSLQVRGPATGFFGSGAAIMTAGSTTIIGTGGSYSAPVPTTGVFADSVGGSASFETGAGISAAGVIFTVTLPGMRTNIPSCTVNIKGGTVAIDPWVTAANSSGTVTLSIGSNVALTNNTPYQANWGICDGF
jgi:hypothetical protein